jgi:hypothetical protein
VLPLSIIRAEFIQSEKKKMGRRARVDGGPAGERGDLRFICFFFYFFFFYYYYLVLCSILFTDNLTCFFFFFFFRSGMTAIDLLLLFF